MDFASDETNETKAIFSKSCILIEKTINKLKQLDQGLFPTDSSLTAQELLTDYANGKLTNAEAIRRSRQKIQEQEPSLRGKNYQGRMAEEEVVRSGINEV